MSVLVTIKFRGDVNAFMQSLENRAADYKRFGEEAQAAGAEAHQFGTGTDYVLVVDKWRSLDDFHAFFGRADLQQFIAAVGADVTEPPEMTVAQAVSSPDQF